MSELNVELYGNLLGILKKNDNSFDFEVNSGIFKTYQVSSIVMSLAVPLLLKYTNIQKKRAGNFFTELLPEGRNYEWLLQSLPYNERNPYGMLRKYGKDIAGALCIYDPEDPRSYEASSAEFVDAKSIRYLLEHMPQAALANSPVTGKTSIGGVQGKILLAKINGLWHRVHNGYPSTHILKPVAHEYPTMIYDEAYCMQVAFISGLTAYPVEIECFDNADALVIERYDRSTDVDGFRIHQEDFNQILGAEGYEKYQEYGGKVSAKRIAQTIVRFGKDEDVENFASQLIFAIAIGNLDMHAKNISLLHMPDEQIKMAPAYDHVPLRHYSTDGKMAFAVGGEYIHANISMKNIVSELISWHCRNFSNEKETTSFIAGWLETYLKAINNVTPNDKAYPLLKPNILSFISNLISGKNTGKIEH